MRGRSNSADKALRRLIEGNERFTKGLRSVESFISALKLPELAERGQSPFCILLACSDSRVPAEILFDQGFGDLFVVRVAGNIVDPAVIASIEFAALSFGTPLCVVMGHTECGAVKAALDGVLKDSPAPTPHLAELVGSILPAAKAAIEASSESDSAEATAQKAAVWNVSHSVKKLRESSETIHALAASGKLAIIGALCDLRSGHVRFEE
jgi:carbonic anhydrase